MVTSGVVSENDLKKEGISRRTFSILFYQAVNASRRI